MEKPKKELKITPRHIEILRVINDSKKEESFCGKIAKIINKTPQRVGYLLKQLTDNKHINKFRKANDLLWYYELTEKGKLAIK